MGLNHQPSWPLHGPVLHHVFEAGGCTDGPTSHLSPLDEQLVLELEGGVALLEILQVFPGC